MINSTFEGEITVASRIVDQLSSGLYESPAACLKELINNAFDADAGTVEVFVKPDADRIIIEDDGTGLSKTEFIKHFSKISESHKRDQSDTTTRGRKKIGKIGIGFIAANEICDTMEIYSTKRGSPDMLHVEIHFDRMRQDPADRRRNKSDFAKGDYTGEVLSTDKAAHFTQVILKRVRANAKILFVGRPESTSGASQEKKSLYGRSADSVFEMLRDSNLTSWADFDAYSQNLLKVALNVPVAYHRDWMPSDLHKEVRPFERDVAGLSFEVNYDGTPLRKPIVFSPPAGRGCLVSRFDYKGTAVSASGYFYAQHGVIRPQELHGLLVRVRHAAIGEYDGSFWSFSPSEGSLIQRWISAEIWADDRLEDALNIDRKTLRVSHPAYMELQAAVHAHLTKVIAMARAQLYDAGSDQRQSKRTKSAMSDLTNIAKTSLRPISASAASAVIETWTRVAKSGASSNALLRKFTVVELYRIVLEAAEETLPPDLVTRFAQSLTQKLARKKR